MKVAGEGALTEGFWNGPFLVHPHVGADEEVVVVVVELDEEELDEVVVVIALLTSRENVPELAVLLESPPYDPLIVTGESEEDGVYFTEHDPDEREHVVEENSPCPDVDQDTVPVGDVPVTVAVQVVALPESTGEGAQTTEVELFDAIVSEKVPELKPKFESPA
jgi:hypothetical protein